MTESAQTTDTLDLASLSDREVLLKAPSYQGGHSKVGDEIADRFAIPFPLRMPTLAKAAQDRGLDSDKLWPWWAKIRDEWAAMEAKDAD